MGKKMVQSYNNNIRYLLFHVKVHHITKPLLFSRHWAFWRLSNVLLRIQYWLACMQINLTPNTNCIVVLLHVLCHHELIKIMLIRGYHIDKYVSYFLLGKLMQKILELSLFALRILFFNKVKSWSCRNVSSF